MDPSFLLWLGERLRSKPGMIDLVMVAMGGSNPASTMTVRPRTDLTEHPRVKRALRYRTAVGCYSDPEGRGVVVMGRGLADRWEASIEVHPGHQGLGLGRALAGAATTLLFVRRR